MSLNNTIIRRYELRYNNKFLDTLTTGEIIEVTEILPAFDDFVLAFEEEFYHMSFLDKIRFYMELVFCDLISFPDQDDIMEALVLIETVIYEEWGEDYNEYLLSM